MEEGQEGRVRGPWRWAVIGCGGMGAHHVKVLEAMPNVELVAGCDTDPSALARLPAGAKPFQDWRQLIEGVDIDAASVILPNDLYPQVVGALLQHGVHVLKEKPMARNLAEAAAMGREAEAAGRLLVVGGQHKFSSAFGAARSAIPELGPIFFVRASMLYRVASIVRGGWGWRGTRSRSGGVALLDAGWHILELLHLIRGLPQRVMAISGGMRVSSGEFDVDELVAVVFEYPDGGLGTVQSSFVTAPGEIRFVAYGQRDSIECNLGEGWARRYRDGEAHALPGPAVADPFQEMYRQFVEAMDQGTSMPGDWRQAIAVQQIVEAGHLSMSQGGRFVELSELGLGEVRQQGAAGPPPCEQCH